MLKAEFVTEIDLETGESVSVYRHSDGGLFAIDTSYIEQENIRILPDPYDDNNLYNVELIGD